MKIMIHAHHVDITDAIKAYVENKLNKLDKVSLGGDVNPVLKSLSRFPPVMVSTVKAITCLLYTSDAADD